MKNTYTSYCLYCKSNYLNKQSEAIFEIVMKRLYDVLKSVCGYSEETFFNATNSLDSNDMINLLFYLEKSTNSAQEKAL